MKDRGGLLPGMGGEVALVHRRKRVTSLVDGVKSTPLVPLHVSDAPNRLDLRNLGSELGAVLVLPLFKQVLVASVARVLIAHPTGAAGTGRTDTVRHVEVIVSVTQHLQGGWTHVPL